MIKEFPNKMWKRRAVDYLIKKIDLGGTTARKPGSGRPKSARTIENVEIVSENAITTEWGKLSQSFINRAINEWCRRLERVVQEQGGHIEHCL